MDMAAAPCSALVCSCSKAGRHGRTYGLLSFPLGVLPVDRRRSAMRTDSWKTSVTQQGNWQGSSSSCARYHRRLTYREGTAATAELDAVTREAIEAAGDVIDSRAALAVWQSALQAPPWDGSAVWIHADLLRPKYSRPGRPARRGHRFWQRGEWVIRLLMLSLRGLYSVPRDERRSAVSSTLTRVHGIGRGASLWHQAALIKCGTSGSSSRLDRREG